MDFDYYWQHLRRNASYQEIAVTDSLLSHSANLNRAEPEAIRHGPQISTERDISGQHFLIELWGHSRFTQSRIYSQRAKIQAMVGRQLLLPELLNPFEWAETELAISRVLALQPDFFSGAQWHAVRSKTWQLVAAWNQAGELGLGWRPYHDPPSTWSKKFPPARHEPSKDFAHAWIALQAAKSAAAHQAGIEGQAKHAGKDAADQESLAATELSKARERMRIFLQEHPRMHFVLDTSLPWGTVAAAIQAEFARVKRLRKSVGLNESRPRPRKRKWREQLEVYDAYLHYWPENRKRFFALQRIWRGNLGFLQALELLEVKLSPSEQRLAATLDERGLKPKGIFKHTDRVLSAIERASYAAALSPNLTDKTRQYVKSRQLFDEAGFPILATDFDYEAVYALLDGESAAPSEESQDLGDEAIRTLASWRQQFSVPSPPLPAALSELSNDKRREWFTAARERIEAIWPTSYERYS